MHIFPQRASLQELGNEIFKLVSISATSEQWAEWLRVPLEHAVARGNLGLVNILLKAGADGSAGWRGCRGRTLLDAAAVGGNPDVLTALLRAGAQPDVNVVSLSPRRSALYVAVVCGHEEVARHLILAGADVRFLDPVHQCSVLHSAAADGHQEVVRDLLIGGADPNHLSGKYGTPLHQAAINGLDQVISALLLRGANKDSVDNQGGTALLWASEDGRLPAVEALLAAGANVDLRDVSGLSALDVAAYNGQTPVIKAILRHGADVNSRDVDGLSALHKAAERSRSDSIDALVEAGADIELKSNTGETPLSVVSQLEPLRSGECLVALLKRGAAVMARDEEENTPLHLACLERPRGLEMSVDLLLRWEADETTLNKSGQSPADVLSRNLDGNLPRCSQEEVERVRLLLSRAPADRAWRRRSWLVMLRSRAWQAAAASHGNDDNGGKSGGSSNVEAGIHDGGRRKIARMNGTLGAEHGGQANGGGGAGAESGGEANGLGLSGIVTLLVEVGLEGVFRTVVSFL
eukprot:g12796.t1